MIRAAISTPCMEPYLDRLHSFISLGGDYSGECIYMNEITHVTPDSGSNFVHHCFDGAGTHLGYTFGNNSILSSAMWFYQRWTKSSSLSQLNLKDTPSDPKNGYVYALAQKSVGLSAFKHVVLVASGQDRYAPFFSARIQTAPTAEEDDEIGSASTAMVKGLLGPVIEKGSTTVTRLGICFGDNGAAFLDSAIGRAAHIQFLEDHSLIHNLVAGHFDNWLA